MSTGFAILLHPGHRQLVRGIISPWESDSLDCNQLMGIWAVLEPVEWNLVLFLLLLDFRIIYLFVLD